MKLLFDFLPYIFFFAAYKFYGIYAATIVAIICSLFQVTIHRLIYKRFESLHLIIFFSILILGGATLLLHNEIFIKWKPTLINWILSVLFIGTTFFGKKPLIQKLMEGSIKLPSQIWRRLNISWFIFCLLLGFANLYVAYNFSTNTWVNFKLFGMLGLTLLFGVLQSLYMAKYADLTNNTNRES